MRLVIHRGSHEIGGTCIVLSSGNSTIWLDIGLPLQETDHVTLPSMQPDAIIISHPHQDHFGLLERVNPDIPVYIGPAAVPLMNAARIFTSRPVFSNRFNAIERNKPFTIGEFQITPFLVDHSAVDAYALLIEAEGHRLLYSGDFRGHGRKSILFEKILSNPPPNIDLLLMEGTMIGRENSEFPDEKSVEETIGRAIANQRNISFVIASSQNIDRLVSVFRACKRQHKVLVIDFYTAWVLEQLRLVTENVPRMDWDNVAVYADYHQNEILKSHPDVFGDFTRKAYKNRIRIEEIRSNPARYVWLSKMSQGRRIKSFTGTNPVNVIYSQWLGYLEKTNEKYKGSEGIAALRDDPKVCFHYAHTSGHAVVDDLKAFVDAVQPKKLVPVHTERNQCYAEHFKNVFIIEDQCGIYV